MSKKTFKPPRIAPLQRVIAEPITDRAEQAALDKVRKRVKPRAESKDEPQRCRSCIEICGKKKRVTTLLLTIVARLR